MSSEKAADIADNPKTDKTIFGKSSSDFLILIITAVTMLALDIVLSIAYYSNASAPDLRWLLALLDIVVVLSFYGAFGGRVSKVLLSMKLALTLLFVVLFLAIIGTIIPQGENALKSDFSRNPLFDFYSNIGLLDMYNSRWFLAILYLLGFNIAFCIFDRLPTTFRRAMRPRTDVKDIFITKCPAAATLKDAGPQGSEAAQQILSRHHYHLHKSESGGILAEKGRWTPLASIAFHLSFLFIGLGAILAGTLGFDESLEIPDGRTAPVPHTDLKVTNHEFNMETVAVKEGDRITGYRPSVYSSDLELTGNGESLARKTITVNSPMRYSSSNWLVTLITSSKVNFHQSSYYQSGSGGYVTVLQVTYKPGKSLIYVGFGLMTIGICALYFPHRRIWLKTDGSGTLIMGGRTNRSRVMFQRDFDRIVAELRLTLGKQEA
ncbi:MAG: cytochrome c biogenesis protein ResB [Actinobacteria bacterium]|nr:cytochrome c biogenesis protein ResB [Actinomycetota bacterium]